MSDKTIKAIPPAIHGNSNGENLEIDPNKKAVIDNLRNRFHELLRKVEQKKPSSNISVKKEILEDTSKDINLGLELIYNYQLAIQNLTFENSKLATQSQQLLERLEDLESKRSTSLANLASVNRNPVTHCNQTGDRPKHPELISEYTTLKTRYIDPLVTKLVRAINPNLEQQERKEKANDIKADISAIVLIGGQEMMGKKSKFTYPDPEKWQKHDFDQARDELKKRLFEKLNFDFTSLEKEIQDRIKDSINKALIFLKDAAIADPPAVLRLENEGDPFRQDYHEVPPTWKYPEEIRITKTIYPGYFVNGDGESKVSPMVLAEPTELSSNSPPPAIESTAINKDTEREIILKATREFLTFLVKDRFPENSSVLEKVNTINSPESIHKLAIYLNQPPNLTEFEQKVNEEVSSVNT